MQAVGDITKSVASTVPAGVSSLTRSVQLVGEVVGEMRRKQLQITSALGPAAMMRKSALSAIEMSGISTVAELVKKTKL